MIQKQLEGLLEKNAKELNDLPSPPSSEPLREIQRMIREFSREVETQVQGIPSRDGLLQQIRPQQEAFRLAIRTTAPCFVPKYKGAGRIKLATVTGSDDWKPHQRFMFLQGEEDYKEIGLDDGNEVFVNDVLEKAKWYAISDIPYLTSPHSQTCIINPGQ